MLLRRSLSIIAVMLVALLLLAACAEETTTRTTTTLPPGTQTPTTTTTTTTTGQGQYGGIFRQLGQDACVNFGWLPRAGANTICCQPYMDYLAYPNSDLTLSPVLATSWELAPDRSYITINLMQGVKFHDGSDFNAEAVKFNMDNWTVELSRVDWGAVDVIDDHTVRLNFNKPYENIFLDDALAIGISSKVAFEKNGRDWALVNAVGTGPFKMVSFERDYKLVYTRNDDYWQEGLPYLDGIEIHFIPDPMTASLAMQAGEGDALRMEGSKIVSDLIAAGFEYDAREDSNAALFPDGANPDSPFADKRVRQAVEYAIDKEAMVAATGYGLTHATYQGPLSWQMGYDPDFEGRQYDPDKARQLLEDAGYPNGFKTTIYPFPAGAIFPVDDAVILQQFLAEVGIDAEIDVIDFAKWGQMLFEGWHNGLMAYVVPGCIFGNPNRDIKNGFGPERTRMHSLLSPPEFQTLLAESLATAEPDEALIREMYRYIFDEALVIPVHSVAQGFLVREGIHDTGYMTGGLGFHSWTPGKLWMEQ